MDKISAAGKYNLSFEEYFSDICAAHSVSSTGLKLIEQKSLAHYWWSSYLNPKREAHDTKAMAFGRACHAWILGEPQFAKYYVLSPYDDFRTKDARAWRESQTRTVIKLSELDAIKAMTAELKKHPLLKNAFADGVPEQSLIWKDKETGIWLKARPDWLPNNVQFVPDMKTTVSAKPEAFARQAFSLGYHQSAALTIDGLREVLEWKSPTYYFVAQEKEPPYIALPFIMRDTDIEMGRMLNRSALRKLANALERDEWPSYATGATEIEMPAWSEKLFLDRHSKGEFTD